MEHLAVVGGKAAHPSQHFDALDSLRGICACMIVLFHLRSTGIVTNAALVQHGWMFVDFFFVLSGFVIGCGYLERLGSGYSVRRFMLLRLGRIYPLHLAVLLALLALEIAGALVGTGGLSARAPFAEPRTLPALASSLALVQIFAGYPNIVWNGPSWSIAAEIWTYLLVALVLRAMPSRGLWLVAGLAAGAALFLFLAGPSAWDPATAYAFARCVLGFSIGLLAWALFSSTGKPALGFAMASLLELAAVTCCVAIVAAGGLPLLAPLLFGGSVFLFAAEGGALSRLLKTRPFTLVGSLSYSIYMIHTLVLARGLDALAVAGRLVHRPLVDTALGAGGTVKVLTFAPDLLAFVLLGVVILCAAATYRWIETPARDASRRWLSRAPLAPSMPLAAGRRALGEAESIATTAAA